MIVMSIPDVEADKEPIWSWSSSSPVTNVAISSDSINLSATYGQSVSLWKNGTSSLIIQRLSRKVLVTWKCHLMECMF